MKQKIIALLLIFLLTACTPELLPVPVTQGPTLAPETSTAVPINAPVVPSPALVFIRMLDENNGWGINDNNVLRTVDGGVTWHSVSPANIGTLGYAVTFDFLDSQRGWLLVPDANNPLAGTLYRTFDGGITWSDFLVPFSGGDLHFVDPKQGWMMASLGAGAGSMGVAVYQTRDDGATWTQTYTNDPNQQGAGDSLPLGGLKNGITPLDMQTAWIGGVIYAPGTIYLYQTKDGGRSWNQVPIEVPAGYEQAELETTGPEFAASNDAYMPVHLSSQNGVLLAIYASHDGGLTWTLTPEMIPQGGSMDFVSAEDGFAWNGTDFYVTHDGAKTWTTTAPDVTFGDNFAGMDFVSPTIGFVLTNDANGARHLYKTTDGGATWNILGQ